MGKYTEGREQTRHSNRLPSCAQECLTGECNRPAIVISFNLVNSVTDLTQAI